MAPRVLKAQLRVPQLASGHNFLSQPANLASPPFPSHMDPANRPPPPSSSSSILIISTLGILTTAILLLSYYFIVVKCGLNLRGRNGFITIPSRRHRSHRHAEPLTFYSAPTELSGLEPSAIRAIPVVRFTRGGTMPSSADCAVCLNEFREEESLRLLPSCYHAFHIDCIDVWLQSNANCPLCRCDITTTPVMFPFNVHHRDGESVVIEVRDLDVVGTSRADTSPESGKNQARKKGRHVSSMGDECIDVGREKDERFLVQPMRRSFSMDSCRDRQFYVAIQELLQQNPELVEGGDGGGSSGGGRFRRSFFSFGHGRSSRLPSCQFR